MNLVKKIGYIFLFIQSESFAQQNSSTSVWYFSGVSYKVSSAFSIWGHYGINNNQDIDGLYIQSFIKINKHITLNPSYLMLAFDNEGISRSENTFMHSVNFQLFIGRFLLENRNMIWNWIRKDTEDLYFYRNRNRLHSPFQAGSGHGKLYAFNEISYSFNQKKLNRNRLGIGFNYDLLKNLNIDGFYALQSDLSRNKTHYILIMLTIQL
ncbi:DUF2490 domain-containing protein [Chryseobacterium taiwanense]|uniref:Outer membrane protein beta-barrel domain-containing protein n=1 Tax=Chryseobacterium taiwanense TaxID=363331 RepID=A0A0B4D282_9FLAO|nr:DUF2490 domain-containing protein [Chryseobacterium taiwanense]KIC62727.1 hypothetical protein RM51_11090 [Chryseobacterium taiwanense]